jgi:hypothetical protein
MHLKTVLACAIVFAPLAVHAADQDFKVVNRTGYQIDSVFLSTPNDNDWGADVMGQGSLGDGESANISFTKGTQACKWDMKVVYNDNDSAVWKALDLCQISKVSLFWNDKTQVTTAKAE